MGAGSCCALHWQRVISSDIASRGGVCTSWGCYQQRAWLQEGCWGHPGVLSHPPALHAAARQRAAGAAAKLLLLPKLRLTFN